MAEGAALPVRYGARKRIGSLAGMFSGEPHRFDDSELPGLLPDIVDLRGYTQRIEA